MKASVAIRKEVGLQPPGKGRESQLILPGRGPLGGAYISGKGEHEIVLFLCLLKDARGKEREDSPLRIHPTQGREGPWAMH